MKILYHIKYPQGMGADRFIYEGYKHAWEDNGHQFFTFSEGDVLAQKLEELKPDLFFTSFDYLKIPNDINIIKRFRAEGVKMFVGVDTFFDKDLSRLAVLKDPDFADVYFTEKEPELMKRFEEKTGKKYNVMPHAADKLIHFPTEPVKKYQYDVVYLGAKLPMKSRLFTDVLIPLTKNKKYRVGVFGPCWTIKDNTLRLLNNICRRIRFKKGADFFNKSRIVIPLNEENQLYSSAKICLNFHERKKDGATLNVVNQRTFKIPACGGFEICDYVPALRKYFNEDEVVIASLSPQDWFNKINYYLNHEKERKAIQEKGTTRALENHTYHNRIKQILELYNELL